MGCIENQSISLSSLNPWLSKVVPNEFNNNQKLILRQRRLLERQNNCKILSLEHVNELKESTLEFSKGCKVTCIWWSFFEMLPKINFLLHTMIQFPGHMFVIFKLLVLSPVCMIRPKIIDKHTPPLLPRYNPVSNNEIESVRPMGVCLIDGLSCCEKQMRWRNFPTCVITCRHKQIRRRNSMLKQLLTWNCDVFLLGYSRKGTAARGICRRSSRKKGIAN